MKYVCVWLGEGWGRGLDLGVTNPVGTEGVWGLGFGGVGESAGVPGLGGWGGVISVCVVVWILCLCRWRTRYLYIVLDGYLRILSAHSIHSSHPTRHTRP